MNVQSSVGWFQGGFSSNGVEVPELEGTGLPPDRYPAIAPPRRHEVDQEGLVSGEVGASHARRGGNLMLGFPLKSFGELRLRLFFVMMWIDPRSRRASLCLRRRRGTP